MNAKYLFPYNSRFVGIFLVLLHIPIVLIWGRSGFHQQGAAVQEGSAVQQGVAVQQAASDSSTLFTAGHIFFISTFLVFLTGLFLIAFSKEKIEDEQIRQLRLDSLKWAVTLNYAILILGLFFTHGHDSKEFIQMNLWIPLVFFIVRFRWVIFRLNRLSN
jgi:hypothetical protein